MRNHFLATVVLIACAALAGADHFGLFGEGTVTEVTSDTITVQQGDVKALTVTVSDELLINDPSTAHHGAKFTEVKKGNRVQFEGRQVNGKWICTAIFLRGPSDAGVVTEVGADTITLRNDKGTTTYKVEKELVDNTRRASVYSPLYPNRFSDVRPGCQIVVNCQKRYGLPTIIEIEVKQEKVKEP